MRCDAARVIEALRASAETLAAEVSDLAYLLALRRAAREAWAAEERKYNPNWAAQPRAPRGQPQGGQWVAGGSGGGAGDGSRRSPAPETPPAPSHPKRPSENAAWRAVGWSADKLRDVEARVTEWANREIPGGLEAAQRVPGEMTRLLFRLGGPDALREYDKFVSQTLAPAGAELVAQYRAAVGRLVAAGRLTRRQAEDATYLVASAAAAGAVLPMGRLAGARPAVVRVRAPRGYLRGSVHYHVGENRIILTPSADGRGPYHAEFVIRADYGSLSRSSTVRDAQNAARADGSPGDVGFHTMAHRFFPHVPTAIVPGDAKLNAGAWRAMENRIGKLASEGYEVRGVVRLAPEGAKRPDRFTVEYEVYDAEGRPGKGPFSEAFQNLKP